MTEYSTLPLGTYRATESTIFQTKEADNSETTVAAAAGAAACHVMKHRV